MYVAFSQSLVWHSLFEDGGYMSLVRTIYLLDSTLVLTLQIG